MCPTTFLWPFSLLHPLPRASPSLSLSLSDLSIFIQPFLHTSIMYPHNPTATVLFSTALTWGSASFPNSLAFIALHTYVSPTTFPPLFSLLQPLPGAVSLYRDSPISFSYFFTHICPPTTNLLPCFLLKRLPGAAPLSPSPCLN